MQIIFAGRFGGLEMVLLLCNSPIGKLFPSVERNQYGEVFLRAGRLELIISRWRVAEARHRAEKEEADVNANIHERAA